MKRLPIRRILAEFGVRATRIRRVSSAAPSSLGNLHWHVWGDAGERYVLRQHAPGRGRDAIEYETRVVLDAAAAGWSVPLPIGQPIELGGRFLSLLTYVLGRSLRIERASQQRRRGALLARLHADLRHLGRHLGQRPTWYPVHDSKALHAAVRWELGLQALESTRPEIARLLREALPRVASRLEAVQAGALPTTIVHGDFTRWNVLFMAGSLSGVIDFDLTHLDSRAADLAMARAAGNPAVLEGYRAEAERIGWPLTAEEEEAVGPLDAAMRIGIVGWELQGLRVAGVMDVDLIERQARRLSAVHPHQGRLGMSRAN